jgi:hypothetical protein
VGCGGGGGGGGGGICVVGLSLPSSRALVGVPRLGKTGGTFCLSAGVSLGVFILGVEEEFVIRDGLSLFEESTRDAA